MATTAADTPIHYRFSVDYDGMIPVDPVTGDAKVITYAPRTFSSRARVRPVRWGITSSTPNISIAAANNTITYDSATAAPTGAFPVLLPDGAYTMQDIEEVVHQATLDNGHATPGATPIFQFGGTPATGIGSIQITGAGFDIDFTAADSPATLLGFPPVVLGPPTGASEVFAGSFVADFAQGVTQLAIHCSLVEDGLSATGAVGTAFASVPVAGNTINTLVEGYNREGDYYGLNTREVEEVTFHITDQVGNPRTLNGKIYFCEFEIYEPS
jgi:hypothetical protein